MKVIVLLYFLPFSIYNSSSKYFRYGPPVELKEDVRHSIRIRYPYDNINQGLTRDDRRPYFHYQNRLLPQTLVC